MPQPSNSQRMFQIISHELDVPLELVTPHASLADDLGADSLDVIELCMAFEEELDIQIEDDEVTEWETVADIAKTLVEKGRES